MDACFVFAAVICFGWRAARANVVVNGSFEGATSVDPTTGDVLPAGWSLGPPYPTSLSKFNIESAVDPSVDLGPEDGTYYARFQSPATNGTWDCLYQDLNTVAGEQYTISFWVADTSTSMGNTVGLNVVWDENTGNQTDLGDNQFYHWPTNTAPVPYQFFVFTEIASTSLTRIDFHGIDADGSILLDNVNVNATQTWTNEAADSLWNTTSSNWNNGPGATVFQTGANVVFNDNNGSAGNYSVTLNATVNPGSVLVNNGQSNYSISGAGSITGAGSLTKTGTSNLRLDTVNSYSGGTYVYGGTLIVGAAGALPGGAVAVGESGAVQLATGTGLATATSLSIAPGGVFDITNNALAVNFSSPANDPVATIAGFLASGFNSGAWTGTGIVSGTAAAGTPGQILSVGYADGNTDSGTPAASNQILVKYTLGGDANLDGFVNSADLLAVVQNFNKTGTDWAHGNFTYVTSGPSTTSADLLLVVQNFNKTLNPAGSGAESTGGMTIPLGEMVQDQPSAVRVPEPGGAAVAAIWAGFLTRRRRRNG
jgi:autotransporter-associated beta strand protein